MAGRAAEATSEAAGRRIHSLTESVGLPPPPFKGSPTETEYKKLSPTPDDFPNFVQRIVATASKGYDFGAGKLKATKAPMFFIHGDADGVRLAHIAKMFRLKGGETHGDMGRAPHRDWPSCSTPPT